MADINLICKSCSKQFVVKYKSRKQKYCSRECVNNSFSGTGNPAYGKTYRSKETNPEWAQKISKTLVEREINKGNKNGMKNPEVAARQGKTRSHKFSSDPTWKENASKARRDAWKSGKYDLSPVGRCKWFDHIKPDGSLVKLQGTWEVVFAKHMDSIGIEYIAHQGIIKYLDDKLIERSYLPDFYIPSLDVYVDVKGSFFHDIQSRKFEKIKESNPELLIFLVTKNEFFNMGIDVIKESKKVINLYHMPSLN